MKGLILILVLLLAQSAHALSLSCSTLFTAESTHSLDIGRATFNYVDLNEKPQVGLNVYMPKVTTTELFMRDEVEEKELIKKQDIKQINDKLEFITLDYMKLNVPIKPKESTTAEEERLREAVEVLRSFYKTSELIREKKGSTRASFDLDVSKENALRFTQVEASVLYRAAELLAARGIQFHVAYRRITLSTIGDHYLNQIAMRVMKKEGISIAFTARDLIEGGAAGTYSSGFDRITLFPGVLLNKSFYQDGILLHEYTHALDLGNTGLRQDRPYHPSIQINDVDQATKKELGIYDRRFSIDEIKAYRTSIRFAIHRALTESQNLEDYTKDYDKIKDYAKMEILFSRITKKVFEDHLNRKPKKGDSFFRIIWKYLDGKNNVSFGKEENYWIGQKMSHDAQSTYEMADFTLKLFTLINKKLDDYEHVPFSEQKALLRRIAQVLSLPEVRKLNGEYPSIEFIEGQLGNN